MLCCGDTQAATLSMMAEVWVGYFGLRITFVELVPHKDRLNIEKLLPKLSTKYHLKSEETSNTILHPHLVCVLCAS